MKIAGWILCWLGWHDFQYVGEQWKDVPPVGSKEGWNHECSRCHKTSWMTQQLKRQTS